MDEIENLKKENERLQKMNENKSDLISISAHHMRTTLSAFKWTLKMFLNKEIGDINEEQKDYLDKMITNNDHILALVNNLLSLNRSNEEVMSFNCKNIDISNTIQKVLSLFYIEAKNKNINILYSESTEIKKEVKCDEEMFSIAFENIIENAIKYSDNNSEIKISISDDKDGKNLIISVNNKGIGIKKEDEVNIFNKFFRAQNAIDKNKVGSGFGLYTTKNIIEKQGGKIWFENHDELGTTFSISLPIS